MKASTIIFIVILMLVGCSTSMKMKLPADTSIVINDRIVSPGAKDTDGFSDYTTRPFFWTSLRGIDYSLMQGEKVVKQGKFPARFRVVSIFWPPYALIYWPLGFGSDSFDFTKDIIAGSPSAANTDAGVVQPAITPQNQDTKKVQ